MKIDKKYPNRFFNGDFEEMKPAKEDVFREENGLIYSQFYEGQLLPIDVYNEVFSNTKNTPVEEEVLVVDQEELQIDDGLLKNTKNTPAELEEEVTVKERKKRRKSIIKKVITKK